MCIRRDSDTTYNANLLLCECRATTIQGKGRFRTTEPLMMPKHQRQQQQQQYESSLLQVSIATESLGTPTLRGIRCNSLGLKPPRRSPATVTNGLRLTLVYVQAPGRYVPQRAWQPAGSAMTQSNTASAFTTVCDESWHFFNAEFLSADSRAGMSSCSNTAFCMQP